jgi:hypothetical protein
MRICVSNRVAAGHRADRAEKDSVDCGQVWPRRAFAIGAWRI